MGQPGDGHDLDLPRDVQLGQVVDDALHLLNPSLEVASSRWKIFPETKLFLEVSVAILDSVSAGVSESPSISHLH